MKLSVKVIGNLAEAMRAEREAGERAVQRGVAAAASGLKNAWRGQVVGAGLGTPLSRAIRSDVYPKGRTSLNAAAMVWTRSPKIFDAFERGALIRSKAGFHLAIPTPAARMGNRRITPGEWERRTGMRLRFVYRPRGPSLLVADDARLNKRGVAMQKRGRRRKDGILTGAVTVPIFILVPQVKLARRLELGREAEAWAARLPGLVTAGWPDR